MLEIIKKSRSIRRFDASRKISLDEMKQILEAARYSPSAANLQSLRFAISHKPETNALIFPHLKWAGYLKYWDGPAPDEQPTAYVLILSPQNCSKYHLTDAGIAAQSMMLMATSMELGACIFAAVDKAAVMQNLHIPESYEICYVMAFGKPAESVVLEDVIDPEDIEYYRDNDGVHHVPKRTLEDIILELPV